jgi:uncharacterized protein YciI
MFLVELAFGPQQDERLAARPAHRQLLGRWHADGLVVTAGPYADESGALLIFDVPDVDELDRLLDEDPYYRTPGVTVVRKHEYRPVVGAGTES